ncbi:MAG TPA: M1 family aminopeptidase [Pyrinomonadaceae bacterium]
MLRVVFICVLLLMALSAASGAERGVDPQPGVARDLARFRALHYSNVRYALAVELKAGAPLLTGTEEIRLTLDEALEELVLDWRVAAPKQGEAQEARAEEIDVNGRAVKDAREVNDHILIPGAYLKKGENVLRLRFASPIAASGSPVTRYLDREDKSEYIYTLFVPSDASAAFPCFDQPDLKARFKLQLTAPESWKVISNTNFEGIERDGAAGTARWSFGETQPISTYLFAFAAGPFAEFREGSDEQVRDDRTPEASGAAARQAARPTSTPLRIFVRRSKAERARRELPELFRLNRECVSYLSDYFDFKFPFPKYDLVLLPEFAYGGMEHAGATFLREDRILFPSDPTAGDLLLRAEVMFHEAAHQWFGDLVTMRWFDDLWLKEGFATFMAYKAIAAIKGIAPQDYNAWKVFYQRTKPGAYATDATKGTTPIWQEINNLSAAKSAYGNIVYLKAPSMLRQAEFFLGADHFQQAVRLLLKEHAYGNAEWADLVHAFERVSGQKLDEWAAAWVRRRGMPDVRAEWSVDRSGRINRLTLKQQNILGEGGTWPMRVELLLAHQNTPSETMTVTMNGAAETIVKEAQGRRAPSYVFANNSDHGYGRFLLDEKSKRAVLRQLGEVRDDFLRALLWGSLWDSVREAELAPAAYIELAIKLVASERDEVTAQSILNRVSTAFNRYLSPAQMTELAPRLERALSERMLNAETQGLRITYFRAFQSNAMTDEARSTLKKILSGELQIPGMTLRSRDRFDIITALLARGDADAPALLAAQAATDQTDDGRRYAYAAGAARADADVKKRYFDAYLNDKQLAESWIESSVNPFNTIHQSALTLGYLERALAELPTLKRARKIFFVNGWLSAFIGGQCNEQALAIVRAFLQREQQLDRDLRLKVMEVTDNLERCVKIRNKYAQSSDK